jgi:uncharacterized membrane protein YoaK (UPF0700 family)
MAKDGKPAPLSAMLPLVALAGCVDAIGWLRLQGTFVSFMSGTSTMLGVATMGGDPGRAWVLASALALFTAGATLGFMLARRVPAWREAAVLGLVAALLVTAWWLPFVGVLPPAAWCLLAAMGALNAALPGVGGITFVTGALTRFGEGLAAGSSAAWRHLALWSALVAGAMVGALLQLHFPVQALVVPAVVSLAGAALATFLTLRRKRAVRGTSAP